MRLLATWLILSVMAAIPIAGAEAAELVSSTSSLARIKVTCAADLSDLEVGRNADSSLLLFKTVAVALPPGAIPRLQVISVSAGELPASDGGLDLSRLAPTDWATLSRPISVRGHRLVTVHVFPIRDGQIHREIEVEVTFDHGQASSGRATSDPEFDRIFSQAIINYETARDWTETRRPAFKSTAVGPFNGGGEWYRMEISATGLIRVSGDLLRSAGMAVGSVPSDNIVLWAGDGRQVPVPLDSVPADFAPVAIMMEDGGDDVFDRNDYLLFYGQGVDRWIYPGADTPFYSSHRYTSHNVYWLQVVGSGPINGSRMESIGGSPSGSADTSISTFRRHIRAERDVMFAVEIDDRIYNYYDWYWTDDLSPEVHISTPNAVAGEDAEIRLSSDLPTSSSSVDLSVNGVLASEIECGRTLCRFMTDELDDGINQFDIAYYANSSVLPYLDWVEIVYTSRLAAEADRAEAAFPGYDGQAEIVIVDEFSDSPILLNIDAPRQPRRITGFEQSNGTVRFEHRCVPDQANRFFASTLSRAVAPANVTRQTPEDLYAVDRQVDYLIISTPEFIESLGRLVSYRESQGLSIEVVDVADIFDNFSYGLFDPTAIRNFLKYTYENYPEPAPAAVLLVGDGHYDYRNRFGGDVPNYIPPFVHAYDTSDSYSDDNYVYFGRYGWLDADSSYVYDDDRGFDMMSARWPVESVSEVNRIIDKVLAYESPNYLGPWRTKVTLVADDEFSSNRDDETVHTQQTEDLQRDYIPRLFERDKIYMVEHEFVNNRKPTVNEAIVGAINDGRLLVNYVGHGNPGLWAHERVFTSADDMPRLNNGYKLPLVFAASCAIGFYDDPDGVAMAEQFLVHPEGGAIAVVSATRLVWSSLNRAFNQTVFDVMFNDRDMSMAQSVYLGKMIHLYGVNFPSLINNDRSYTFFGEPFLKLARPTCEIEFTQVPDTLRPLQVAVASGRIVDDAGQILPVDGRLQVRVYDSDRMRTYVPSDHGGSGPPVTYSKTGAVIYRGAVSVIDGQFDFSFMPPLDISYGGRSAHLSAYGEFNTFDAAGMVDSLPISEAVSEVSDYEGPDVTISLAGRPGFVSGDYAARTDSVVVVLDDSAGINLTGWLGHGITLVIDDQSEAMVNLTPQFSYFDNSYSSGSLTFTLDTLSLGRHDLRLKAWDNANNSTTLEFAVEIADAQQPVIKDVLNYPNPMREETAFSFYATEHLEKFSIEIFTLAGRKIKSFDLYSVDAGYRDDIVWRGEDETGDRVATGIYMFKATGQPASGREAAVVYGKVVVSN